MIEKNCSTCKHAGWDDNQFYCANQEILKKHPFGLSIFPHINPKGIEGICSSELCFPLYEEKK